MQKLVEKIRKNYWGEFVAVAALMIAVLIWQLIPNDQTNVSMKMLSFTIEILLVIAVYVWHQKVNMDSRKLYQYHAKNKVNKVDKIVLVLFAYTIDRNISPAFKFGDNPKNEDRIIKEMSHQSVWEGLYKTGIKAPIVEEIVFRGLLYSVIVLVILYILNTNIEDKSRRLIATYTFVFVSSTVFGILHVSPYGDYENAGVYILPGIIFSIVFILTKNVMYSIVVHMLGNVVSTLNTYYYKLHDLSLPLGEYLNHLLGIILIILIIERLVCGFRYVMCHKREISQLSDKELRQWVYQRLKERYIYSEN